MTRIQRQINEEAFEKSIEQALVGMHGYLSRKDSKYDRELAMDKELLFEFLQKTQAEKLTKLQERHGVQIQEKLFLRIDREIAKRGILDVLRKGVSVGPVHFNLMYFLPVSGLNPEARKLYEQNIFSVMRQVHFSLSSEQSVDMALFVNGLPIATAELKNEATGQTVENAKRQYKMTRSSREKLFSFKRCVAHFAVDTSQVFVTTRLAEEKTFFLPFNKGFEGGAGNPPVEGKHKMHYLWEDIWSKESWSDLIQNFVAVMGKDGKEKQIFPRFHQLNTVRRLASDVPNDPKGKNYLIQHSAGSGKSMTIAWTAYRLAQLHDENNEKIFDSVFVITDRRVLDKQLRETVKSFQPVSGFLYTVREDKGAKTAQLTEAIEKGAKVITTTIAVFPFVAEVIGDFPGKRFAIIVDEAHSSQGGEVSRAVHEVLGARDEEVENAEDFVMRQLKSRKQGKNISYFAFTATPKQSTLELFGEKTAEGYKPYSLYSMKQAIEEKFILDVLQNYTTYRQYFKILKKVPDNPELPRARALSAIRRYIRNHPRTIEQKIGIIVEHFRLTVAPLIYGKAKAMIVTNSRESAVRYKLAIDKFLKENGYDFKTLVAFSDEIKIDGEVYTETNMNGLPESQTAQEFKKPEYKFLIVANKYQTGFDEPLLSAIYVDKKLSGVNAVQTLSRLNRTYPGKERVFVLDFANTVEEIQEAFSAYYTTTILSEGLDENIINDTVRELEDIYPIADEYLDEFVALIDKSASRENTETHSKINALLDKVVNDMLQNLDEEQVKDFRAKAGFFVKIYPYAESVFAYQTERNEKLYWFMKYILKKLPKEGRVPIDIVGLIDTEHIKVVRKQKNHLVLLDVEERDIYEDMDVPEASNEDGEFATLEEIIKKANEEWGAEFGKKQIETLEEMKAEFLENDDLKTTVKNNFDKRSAVSVVFGDEFEKALNKRFNVDRLLWETLSSNKELKKFVRGKMLDAVFRVISKNGHN